MKRLRLRLFRAAPLSVLSTMAMAGLAGVGLASAGLGGMTGTARAAYIGSDGRIAYVRGGDIFSINPADPGAGSKLLAGGGRDSGPRWSPSGKKLAYIDDGNLWIMNANGSHKQQITRAAPRFTDGRPTWSPNGRYLAFVRTARRARVGYVTRYDRVTHSFRTYTARIGFHLIKVPALPGTAVAWSHAVTGDEIGNFLLYSLTGPACTPGRSCIGALGFPTESKYANVFPSLEDSTASPRRLADPDWYPISPEFYLNVLISIESCPMGVCTHKGIKLAITSPLILPGAYEAVYSPTGSNIAFVRNGRRGAGIYTKGLDPAVAEPIHFLTAGTEPDWQPVAPLPG
jgi:Dipeptidyl peptidase IV (DPP IV) N-terminal region